MHGDRLNRRPVYEIKVTGKIDERWSDWFGGMEIASTSEGSSPVTVLTGFVADQPALRGLLTRLWDLNLTVVSVRMVGQPPELPDGIVTRKQVEGGLE